MRRILKKIFQSGFYLIKYASDQISNQLVSSNLNTYPIEEESLGLKIAGPNNQEIHESCQMDPKDVLQQALEVLQNHCESSDHVYKKIVGDLISRFSILKKDNLLLRKFSIFNWYENSKYYHYLPELNPNSIKQTKPGINPHEIYSEYKSLYYIIQTFLELVPRSNVDNIPKKLFNIFFDIIYVNTIKRTIEFYNNNLFRLLEQQENGNSGPGICAFYSVEYLADLLKKEDKLDKEYSIDELLETLMDVGDAVKNIFKCLGIDPDSEILGNLTILGTCCSFLVEDKTIQMCINPKGMLFCPKRDIKDSNELLAYILKFIIGSNTITFESVLKRSLAQENIEGLSIVKKYLIGFNDANFFDFNYENFKFYFLVQMVNTFKEFEDVRVPLKSKQKMIFDDFRKNFRFLSHSQFKDSLFCHKTFELCLLFLENPESHFFNKITDIFTNEEIDEMLLYGMIEFKGNETIKLDAYLEEESGSSALKPICIFEDLIDS